MKTKKANQQQIKRKVRVRAKISKNITRPRLHVYRSSHYIYAQIIDDEKGITQAAASEKEFKKTSGTKTDKAKLVGVSIAKKAKLKKITRVRFDRGNYKYHGRVKALAEAARIAGLEF